MYGLPQVPVLARPVEPGAEHVEPDGEAHEQVDNEHVQRASGAHRRQGVASGKAAHHHDVRGIEQQLQNPGDGQGDGKLNQLAQKRPLGHVDLIGGPPSPGQMESHKHNSLSHLRPPALWSARGHVRIQIISYSTGFILSMASGLSSIMRPWRMGTHVLTSAAARQQTSWEARPPFPDSPGRISERL